MWVWEKQSVSPALAGGTAANQTKDSNVQKMREFNEEGCVGVFTLFMLVQVSCSLIKMMMSRELPVLITFYLHFRLTSFWSRLKLNIYLRVQPCDGAMEDEKKFICQLLIINQAKTPCRICEEVLIYGEKLVPSQPGVSCSFSTDWVCLTARYHKSLIIMMFLWTSSHGKKTKIENSWALQSQRDISEQI